MPLCLFHLCLCVYLFYYSRCRQGVAVLNSQLLWIQHRLFFLSHPQWRTSVHFTTTRARQTRSFPSRRGRWSACWAATRRRTTASGRASWTAAWASSPPCWWRSWPRTGWALEEGRATYRCVHAHTPLAPMTPRPQVHLNQQRAAGATSKRSCVELLPV